MYIIFARCGVDPLRPQLHGLCTLHRRGVFSMGRAKDSLKHQLRAAALNGITDSDSLRAYRRACDAFSVWAKEQGIRDLKDVSMDVIQAYEVYLESRVEGYSPSTLHSKLVAPCKAAGISMKEIRKPKRTAGRIQRGRSATKTGRGEREAGQERFRRLVELQKCVGIRRAELSRLTGGDLIEDDHGGMYIHVRRGKGGKEQLQYVLPDDRETVRRIFDGIGPEDRVFTAEEMRNHINLHGMRAAHARACYSYYADAIAKNPAASEALRAALLRRWDNGHMEMQKRDTGRYRAAQRAFCEDLDDRPYLLRGENREKAVRLGLPTEYNRLALMAVSVFHLSHWRLSVSVVNYLIQ